MTYETARNMHVAVVLLNKALEQIPRPFYRRRVRERRRAGLMASRLPATLRPRRVAPRRKVPRAVGPERPRVSV